MLEQFHVPEQDRVYVEIDRMRAATEALFMRCGVEEAGAKASTDVLLTNDLRAVETHGVSNMMRNYVAQYMAGTLNPTPDLKIVRETATTANVDGDGALGIQIGGDMMQIAIDKAKQFGTGAVTVFDSGHLGGCGYYAAQAAQQGMVGLVYDGRPRHTGLWRDAPNLRRGIEARNEPDSVGSSGAQRTPIPFRRRLHSDRQQQSRPGSAYRRSVGTGLDYRH